MENLKQLAKEFNLPYYEKLTPLRNAEFYEKVPLKFLREHGLVPIKMDEDSVHVAVSHFEKLDILDTLVPLVEKHVRGVFASPEAVNFALHELEKANIESSEKVMDDLKEEGLVHDDTSRESKQNLLDHNVSGAVVKLVNRILLEALQRRATDIHIQPGEKSLQVRFRIDGVLYDWDSPPLEARESILSRIKIMSGLNIAEKRLPQDGRTTIQLGEREVDIRVSVVPSVFGERAVLRLLDKENLNLDLKSLGFNMQVDQKFRSLITLPHGIVLVTGPTGSGKTTTLYSSLSYLETKSRNIMTVEDPIEYRFHGISQMQVKPEIGLTFATALRSLLRQDPDVLMVGEIRDRETAEVAVQAALTGHLVLATLHTNDAASALTRLQEIGIEPYLIASTVRGVLAQRLVRLVCQKCGGKKKKCSVCLDSGYCGRTGIYEFLQINEELKKAILKKSGDSVIRQICRKAGFGTLREDGLAKVRKKLTTREEVLRVTT